ncbi:MULTISPECIES: SPOR domain-containing protein [Pseudoalteromonas]|uniref:DedD protein n=1 Tax=Pseudoalteromonas amylolytica TaxID=1859457 RepID=A0A1S1MLH5_9GAMM|nr:MULTISPECIES: SPOR domain-containing protein [Pseudoalteromonas]OHU86639.1 DedD protein [Pseudoalteromonas sp. JW3]OHU88837.1 DedD protein [Pseudoalteromonas amylolytica]
MDSGFINRLVGTSIVVVAAIIFIPNILDGEKVHYKEGFKAIPERPEFTTVDLQSVIDERAELAPEVKGTPVEDIASDDQQFVAASTDDGLSKTQNVSSAEPTITKAKQPDSQPKAAPKASAPKRSADSNLTSMAYVIQLGSFSHKPNVDALVEKLTSNGFKAFTRPVQTPNGTLTKVFVGPDLNKAKLEAKLPELKKLTKLNGRLTQFEIAK